MKLSYFFPSKEVLIAQKNNIFLYFYIFIFSQYTTFLILIKYRENPRLQVVFIKKGINALI